MATVGIKGLKYEGPMLKHLSGNTKESGSKSKDIPMRDKMTFRCGIKFLLLWQNLHDLLGKLAVKLKIGDAKALNISASRSPTTV